jgi:hypothetical protein
MYTDCHCIHLQWSFQDFYAKCIVSLPGNNYYIIQLNKMWYIPYFVSLASLLPIVFCDSGLIVQTTSGEVHGFINQSTPLVRQFLGVPYAEPPLGDLRFMPPQTKRNGRVINATAFAPSCMQQFSNSSTIYTAQVP